MTLLVPELLGDNTKAGEETYTLRSELAFTTAIVPCLECGCVDSHERAQLAAFHLSIAYRDAKCCKAGKICKNEDPSEPITCE